MTDNTIGNIADSYFKVGNYCLALQFFEKTDTSSLAAEKVLEYAKILIYYQNYKKAEIFLYLAQKKKSTNPLVNAYIQSCKYAIDHVKDSPEYVIEKTTINTFGESFGIQFFKEGVVFAAPLDNGTDYINGNERLDRKGQHIKNLCFIQYDGVNFGQPVVFSKKLVYKYHVGAPCFSQDYMTMYYTMSVKKNNKMLQQIFKAEYNGKQWKEKGVLNINSDEYSCAHPSISSDGKRLFFSSDMPGGYGGKDIYYSDLSGDTWDNPVNLGEAVNTCGDEVFPFINANSVLYFSSDGHSGYGGLDIFSAIYWKNKWTKVTNKRKPLNSSGDDFSIIVNPENKNLLLFSSNRQGKGNEDYIFKTNKIDMPADTIKGVLKDDLTNEAVTDASVYLLEDSVLKDTIAHSITNNKGEYSLIVPAKEENAIDRDLFITVDKKGYEKIEMSIDEQYFETEMPNFDISIKAEIKVNHIYLFHNILFDLGSGELTEESKKIMNKVALVLMENKGMKIELSAHTDSRGDAEYNFKLSSLRAENAKEYLVSKGIDKKRIDAKGYGELKLLNHCTDGIICTEEEHTVNRRIEIKILEL